MNISLKDFYRIGRDAVKFFPANAECPCLQLQAFRVLTRGGSQEITTDSLGAIVSDKGGPFFWSRKWNEAKSSPNAITFDYPILTMFEVIGETGTSPFVKPFYRDYTIEIAVLDVYKDDAGRQSGCKARTVNDIYIDTGRMLDAVLAYFGGIVEATFANGARRIYYKPYLEANIGAQYDISGMLLNTINSANKQVRFSRVDRFATNNIYGTKCQIIFRENSCDDISFNTQIPDFGVIGFEPGCTNC